MPTTLVSPPVDPPGVADPDLGRKPGLHIGFGPLLRRFHFYAGILVAPFLFVVAFTGLAFAFTPQLDAVAYHDQLHTQSIGTHRLPLAQQVAAAQRLVPAGSLAAIHLPGAPDATTRVEFSLPELGDRQRTVYLDPYTGEVRGVLTTRFGSTPTTTWLERMHSNLNLGDTGRLYSELAASWLWVLVLGGIVLWWRHQRGKRLSRRLVLPDATAGKGVRRTRSLHAATGVWLAVALLFLSATGLTWSQHAGANFSLLRTTLNSDSIPLRTGISHPDGQHHSAGGAVGAKANVDALASAAATLGGPATITPAEEPGRAWTVEQTDNTWPVHRDKIAVHPHTGEIVDTVAWAQQPLLSKLTTLGILAHMGTLFGLANQILLAAVAIGLISAILSGYRMWWQRRPTRAGAGHGLGAAPRRGAWRHLPIPALAVTAVAAVAIGWAIPLLGWTLLAFVVADAILGLIRYRASR